MKRFLITALFVIAVVVLGSGASWAKSSLKVYDIHFDKVRRRDFASGYVTVTRQPIDWESAHNWDLYIEPLASDLGQSYDGQYSKPLEDLEFKKSSDTSWTTMLNQQMPVALDQIKGKGTLRLDWRVRLRLAYDRPGQYGVELRFTMSEQ